MLKTHEQILETCLTWAWQEYLDRHIILISSLPLLKQYCFSFAEPPRLVKIPSDLTTSVNKTIMLDCKATSDFGIKYSWFQRVKGSSSLISILKLDKRFNIFPNGSLEIRRVQKKDEAYYHCKAENPIGSNNVSAFLRVLGKRGYFQA